MATTEDLGKRIEAALASIEEKHKAFQESETRKYLEWKQRLEKLHQAFDTLTVVIKPRLDVLIQKFGDKVVAKPTFTESSRELVLDFQSDVARISLSFKGMADGDIRKLILNYDLTIIPILMQFDSHGELEIPLDAVDTEAAVRWTDERIMSFVQTYVAIQENQYYLRDQMVTDPVVGTTFPKLAAGAKLERGGRTYHFVSEVTRREFEKGMAAYAK